MLRARLNDALKDALKQQDKVSVATVRLILAALKDRDIAVRAKGRLDGIGEDEILQLLQSMIKQRHESRALYGQGGRTDLAEREAVEIGVIEQLLPEQMDADEMAAAVGSVISELDARGLKDMGRTMAALRERYAGRMDFARTSALVKEKLT